MTDKVEIKIDNFLFQEAETALGQYPKTPAEQIERWCYLGKVASQYLTEDEMINLQLGHGRLVFETK